MRSYFVTATGTDIGKTYVTAGIIRAARESGRNFSAIKPILSGYDPAAAAASDSAILLEAMGKPVTPANIAAITPWRYAAPISPAMAAAREGKSIDFDAVLQFCQAAILHKPDLLLIEGAGGAAVPLDNHHLIADWIHALRIPAILVAGTYLGTVSHTITTAELLAARGIRIAAIVLSESETPAVTLEETATTLSRFLPAAIHTIPRHLNDRSFRDLACSL